jgi:hypothetical protein
MSNPTPSQSPSPTTATSTKEKPSTARRIFRFLGWFLAVTVVLVVLLAGIGYYLLWKPSVQQQLLQQFTSKMSEEWNVVFRIDSMAMKDFSHFKFYNFYLEDPDQDTLLYAELVEAQHVDLWELWEHKRIDVGRAKVANAVFKVQRTPRKRYFSLDFIIDYFHEEDPVPVEERAKLSIDTAEVSQVRYKYVDASNGIDMTVVAEQVYAAGHDVDLIQKRALLDTAYLNNSQVYIALKKPVPIPDSVPPSPYNTLPDTSVPPWHLSSHRIDVEKMTYRSTESLAQQVQHHQAVRHNKKGNGEAATTRKQKGMSKPNHTQAEKNKAIAAHQHLENKNLTNLHVRNIRVRVDSFELHEGRYTGQIQRLSAAMSNGFQINSFRGDFDVHPERAALTHFRLNTEKSSFGNAVVLDYDSYDDLKDFTDKVYISFNLSDCHFVFSEIGVFVPSLLDNFLIKMNQNTTINISGEYHGFMKYFQLSDIDVQLGKGVKMDKAQAAKKTPVEWLIKTFGPKNKARQARERAKRQNAREERQEERQEKRATRKKAQQ